MEALHSENRSMTVHEKPSPSLYPEALSLPARYYIDPANHQAELERFFLGMWIHVGRADQIPVSGDYVLRDIADESLIVTRANDGAIHAFYNVCRHRGTRLCEAAEGTLDGLIRCPTTPGPTTSPAGSWPRPRRMMCQTFLTLPDCRY